MTVGGCIQQINKLYLGNDVERMAAVGMEIIRTLKEDIFESKDFPRRGWFLLLKGKDVLMTNGPLCFLVDLNPKRYQSKKVSQLKAYSSMACQLIPLNRDQDLDRPLEN